MISNEKLIELKEHLENAKNPIFFYDNDADGLCAYIILRRVLGRGYGVAVRSYPELDERYSERIEQLKADSVFVLDKAGISDGFIKKVREMNLPLIWIDHHDIGMRESIKEQIKSKDIDYYNSSNNGAEPTTYIVQNIFNRNEDKWIALVGCIADHYMPDFAFEVEKQYPDLWSKKAKKPFDVLYNTEFGKIIRAINFGLKDSITNVVLMQNYLIKCKTPLDVLAEVSANESLRQKFETLQKAQQKFVLDAEKEGKVGKNLIFYKYGGDSSISSDIANEVFYRNGKKYVAICFVKGDVSNVSLRGKDVKQILSKVLSKIENATGGGHMDAVGARIRTKDLEKFKELLTEQIEEM